MPSPSNGAARSLAPLPWITFLLLTGCGVTRNPTLQERLAKRHLPDVVITLQPNTPQVQADPTPNDNDGGSDTSPNRHP